MYMYICKYVILVERVCKVALLFVSISAGSLPIFFTYVHVYIFPSRPLLPSHTYVHMYTHYPSLPPLSLSPSSQRSVMRAMSQRRRKLSTSPKKRQRQNQKKLLTVSAHFRESLHRLMERLFAASPHFVRSAPLNTCTD